MLSLNITVSISVKRLLTFWNNVKALRLHYSSINFCQPEEKEICIIKTGKTIRQRCNVFAGLMYSLY